MAIKNGHRNEVHVCNDVVQAQGYKGECGEPNCQYLRCDLAGRDGNIDGKANEPICSNSSAEDLNPARGQTFGSREVDDLRTVSGNLEDSTICTSESAVLSTSNRWEGTYIQ